MSLEFNLSWADSLPIGWRAIFEDTVHQLHALHDDLVVEDAKQKFGELRIDLDRENVEAHRIVDLATARSRISCEECGATARPMRTADGYYSTRCPDHAEGFVTAVRSPMLSIRFPIVPDTEDQMPPNEDDNAAL